MPGGHATAIPTKIAAPPLPVLVLQGGGALGSYQAGVFQALDEAGFCPGWVAGISIGAINAALIAGNPPERRLPRLIQFWERVTGNLPQWLPPLPDAAMQLWHEWAAVATAVLGAPGFFLPRPPWAAAMPGNLSWYDTAPLRATLLDLVDWDLVNSGAVRLSVGAVNVETGNFRYFDSAHERLGPEHVMASGALPPGLPPVEIDGCLWWDGGLVSNTPLDHVLAEEQDRDLAIFQVDLFPARGARPASIADAEERATDIRFSSRTRLVTDMARARDAERCAIARLIARLPPELAASADVALLRGLARPGRVVIGQLIYRDRPWQGSAKGREFSRASMLAHWQSGLADARGAVARVEAAEIDWRCGPLPAGVASFDLSAPG